MRMSPSHLRAILERLSLSQMDAARFLEVDGRTMRRWISGEVIIPKSVQIVFRLLDECPAARRFLKSELPQET